MRQDVLERQFNRMGAHIKFKDEQTRKNYETRMKRWRRMTTSRIGEPILPAFPTVDVRGKKDEVFIIDDFGNEHYEFQVLDNRPELRHLLLMLKDKRYTAENRVSKYLCGHDERHWFVAAVPEEAAAKNVEDALRALKPERAIDAQRGVKRKNRHRRRNRGYIRQGEWFFVPAPGLDTSDMPIHKKEPINRGRGTPHICEEVIRIGGREVYVNSLLAPSGVSRDEYDKLIKADKYNRLKAGGWRTAMRDMRTYARGYIRHPDHKTVRLSGWHEVLPNTESKAAAMRRLVFLD